MAELRLRDLEVWRVSMDLVVKVYEITREFPKSEQFGLASQLQRSAVSIPSNIAEGSGRGTKRDFAHFLDQARGSLFEVITQLEISRSLSFGNSDEIKAIQMEYEILGMRINALISTMKDSRRIRKGDAED
ncbi:MAG: S23 ribosomal protein [Mesotoga prima]|jgi:four helix bundle protein|uniref:S23 ribosomal protein n=1 Tax=Mesotoga prima TaxID=1184387 RepID=A0A117M269_9BACT|nr:MAG: S23 ribosomal protein [Mesotoga prima]